MLHMRLTERIPCRGVRIHQPEQLLNRTVEALILGRLVHRKPFNGFIIPLSVICKNITRHSPHQGIAMLVHEVVVVVLERLDHRINQMFCKIGRVLVSPL
ncbi:hypothetical protein D3C73_1483800 [compost metagenome]